VCLCVLLSSSGASPTGWWPTTTLRTILPRLCMLPDPDPPPDPGMVSACVCVCTCICDCDCAVVVYVCACESHFSTAGVGGCGTPAERKEAYTAEGLRVPSTRRPIPRGGGEGERGKETEGQQGREAERMRRGREGEGINIILHCCGLLLTTLLVIIKYY
jgi:hypothetical protein